MGQRAKAGTCLASLVKMAVPLCQRAERECPRTGPGRKPDIPDWVMAVLIMVAVLKRKKSKSGQYRFLAEHRRELQECLDIWRELRNARNAAAQRYVAAIEERNYVVTRTIAEIAESYYELMALDKRLENLNQTIQLQEQSFEIAKAKKEAGRGTELAVQRFQAEVRKNQSDKQIVSQEIIEVENRINFLLNRLPQPVERNSANFYDLQINTLHIGVPAQLLANRPDVRQAERELEAAGLEVRVARARFFPTIDLSAGVGYEAFSPKYLFRTPESLIYNVAGDLVAPLINKSAIRAEYLTANAEQLQAVYNYQRVVLNAFTEVVNRISRVENYFYCPILCN